MSVMVSEIPNRPLQRFQTWMLGFDWLYGYSIDERGEQKWGPPLGYISLWSGESGIGKSRLAIHIAKKWCEQAKILYVMAEAPIEDFWSWAGEIKSPQNFWLTNASKMIEIEKEARGGYSLIVIDSINMIKEYRDGLGAELIVNGGAVSEGMLDGLRKIASEQNCHIVLLNQLNQDGTVKGGTKLTHLIDCHLELRECEEGRKDLFLLKSGVKMRGGRLGKEMRWRHFPEGVYSCGDGAGEDPEWRGLHGLPPVEEQAPVAPPSAPVSVYVAPPLPPPAPVYVAPLAPTQKVYAVKQWDGRIVHKTSGQMSLQEAINSGVFTDEELRWFRLKHLKGRAPMPPQQQRSRGGLKGFFNALIGRE